MALPLNERQLAILERLRTGSIRLGSDDAPIGALPADARRPLSKAQRRILFEEELRPGNIFNGSLAIEHRGALDADFLKQALDFVVARHQILRANVVATPNGHDMRIRAVTPIPIQFHDLRTRSNTAAERLEATVALAGDFVREHIDIYQASCLIRAAIFRIADDRSIIVLAMHMFAFDAPSGAIFSRELIEAYQTLASGKPPQLREQPYQYPDYVAWEASQPPTDHSASLQYWQNRLSGGAPEGQLPCDRARRDDPDFAALRRRFTLDHATVEKLRALARLHSASFYMVLLASLKTLLFRHGIAPDVSVGAWTVQRNARNRELVGPLVNTLVYRTHFSIDDSFIQVLEKVRESARGAYVHAAVPFEDVVAIVRPDRSARINPLFQVHFILQEVGDRQQAAGFRLSELDSLIGASGGYDVEMVMRELDWGVEGHFELNCALFDPLEADALTDRFQLILKEASAYPDRPIGTLSLGPSPIQAAHACETPPLEQILDRLLTVAGSNPALVKADDSVIDFAGLRQRLSVFECWLDANLGSGEILALLGGDGIDHAIALLAALRRGVPILILDHRLSAPVTTAIITSAGISVTWVGDGGDEEVDAALSETCRIVRLSAVIASMPAPSDPAPAAKSRALEPAYGVLTSGTGGPAKLAWTTRESLANHLNAIETAYGHDGDTVTLQLARQGFDVFIEEVVPTLCFGGRVVAGNFLTTGDLADLGRDLAHHQVTLLNLSASLFTAWAEHILIEGPAPSNSVQRVIVGSEEVDYRTIVAWQRYYGDRIRLLNAYGLTETSITNCIYEIPSDPERLASLPRIPIGFALPGSIIDIVDLQGRPLPAGAVGEIRIKVTGSDAAVATGDLGRRRFDGALEWLGRRDRKVKRLGSGFDLTAIERALERYPGVNSATCRVDNTGVNSRIVALVALDHNGGEVDDLALLRALVDAELPRELRPDRIELAGAVRPLSIDQTDPRFSVLSTLWSEALGRSVEPHENLYIAGATSMDCLTVITQAQLRGLPLKLVDIYETPTIEGQMARMGAASL